MKRTFLGMMLILAGAALPAQANFDKAMEAYTAGNFTEAYRSFDALAAIGDYGSAFNIGVMYYRGEYVERDPVEAWAWMQLAGSESDTENMLLTAEKVFSGLSVAQQQAAKARLDALLDSYSTEVLSRELAPVLLSDDECDVDRTPVSKKQPVYPWRALRAGEFGRVVVEYSVMPGGHVRDVGVVQTSGEEFSQACPKHSSIWPAVLGQCLRKSAAPTPSAG
ncbi:hypothetical protein GNX18_13575 [Microbulbifer sp. SH-1]|uniref:energy transducer TonB n=1 Tax=Microbulbifer sp. SH-1 TaxID=2681547 RepID=UPI00140A9FF8|nr:energy transducer TonB [Microbulbifer sp. SH-1]QIL90675.1 hypothetical protein GNX18_13575 [Microbulbifer sp. SH-1]